MQLNTVTSMCWSFGTSKVAAFALWNWTHVHRGIDTLSHFVPPLQALTWNPQVQAGAALRSNANIEGRTCTTNKEGRMSANSKILDRACWADTYIVWIGTRHQAHDLLRRKVPTERLIFQKAL